MTERPRQTRATSAWGALPDCAIVMRHRSTGRCYCARRGRGNGAKVERNNEIARRITAGEPMRSVAVAFGLSRQRVMVIRDRVARYGPYGAE